MALFEWNKSYELGIADIDSQHKKLVDIINELHEAMSKGKGREIINTVLESLIRYTKEHFSSEENYLEKCKYPELGNHQLEHKNFIDKLSEVENKQGSARIFLTIEIMEFLKDWLSNHILISDKKYIQYLK